MAGNALAALAFDRFAAAARDAGCPPDLVSNLIRAGCPLQPKQLRASAAARECDRPDGPDEVGYGGARGGGKSHWMMAQMAADDCQRYPGLKCLLLRKVGRSNTEGMEDLLPKVIGGLEYDYVPTKGQLRFPNGSRIVTGHFQNEKDIDKYLGLEYDTIGVEEATTLTSSKYKAIQTCNRTSKPGWRPRIYSTTNPGGIGHAWYKRRFVSPARKGAEHETRFIPATVDDNRATNPGYRKVLDRLTGWQLRAWRYGDWDIAAGQFFTTWRADLHVLPAFDVPLEWDVWLALDYGFTHYTACYLMGSDGDGNIYALDEHAERRALPETHASAIRDMLGRNGIEPHRVLATVAGHDVFSKDRNGRTIAEDYEDAGLVLERAINDRINGAGTILKRLGDPERGIPPTLFISERCPRLIECLPAMEHDPAQPEKVRKVDTDDDGVGGDDSYDAFRYGVMHHAGLRAVGYSDNPFDDWRG
ncbi:phage terminase large subunit (plasmid) [Isosphaeraceae bacterium EP7]